MLEAMGGGFTWGASLLAGLIRLTRVTLAELAASSVAIQNCRYYASRPGSRYTGRGRS